MKEELVEDIEAIKEFKRDKNRVISSEKVVGKHLKRRTTNG
jgi:hypothetical protein